MKRLAIIFLLLCALRANAAFTVTNEIDGTEDWSSYHSPQFSAPSFVLGGAYKATYWHCMYPQFTNHLYCVGQSGASLQTIYQSNEEKIHALLWSSFPVAGYDWIMLQNNGGYGSNAAVEWSTNIFAFPPVSYNGSGATNEDIPCAGVYHVPLGDIPDGTPPSGSLSFERNAASTNLDVLYGAPMIDLESYLRTNGYSTNALFGYFTGGHPFAAGSLIMAMFMLEAQGVETNVGSITFNWGAATASTNHCVASGISISGNALTATIHWDRMPMWFDVADGVNTNDATAAFLIAPDLASSMPWILQATNLPSGIYTVAIDGSNVVTLTSSQLAAGWNMFTNYNGAFAAQRKAVFYAILDQLGADHVTRIAHSAGSMGTLGKADMVNLGNNAATEYDTNGKRGTNYLAAMAPWVDQVRTNYDVAIHNAAVQTNHTFSITLNAPRFAPFHK